MRGYWFAFKLLFLLGAAGTAFWAGVRWKGAEVVRLRAEMDAYKANAERIIAEEKARQAKVTEVVVTKYLTRAAKVKEVTKEVVREVKVAVPAQYDASCPLPLGWVRIHDSACTNTAPGPTSAVDGTPSTVSPSDALETVVTNYGICHENAEKLLALQEWVRLQYGEKEKPAP